MLSIWTTEIFMRRAVSAAVIPLRQYSAAIATFCAFDQGLNAELRGIDYRALDFTRRVPRHRVRWRAEFDSNRVIDTDVFSADLSWWLERSCRYG
jgi:hypothetical protein